MLNGQDSRWEPVVAEQLLAQNKIDERHPLHLNVLYDDEPLHVNIAQRLVGQLTQSDMLRVDAQPVNWQTLQMKRQKVISKSFVLAGVRTLIIRWHSWVCSILKVPIIKMAMPMRNMTNFLSKR